MSMKNKYCNHVDKLLLDLAAPTQAQLNTWLHSCIRKRLVSSKTSRLELQPQPVARTNLQGSSISRLRARVRTSLGGQDICNEGDGGYSVRANVVVRLAEEMLLHQRSSVQIPGNGPFKKNSLKMKTVGLFSLCNQIFELYNLLHQQRRRIPYFSFKRCPVLKVETPAWKKAWINFTNSHKNKIEKVLLSECADSKQL